MNLMASSMEDFAESVIIVRQLLMEKERIKADESGKENFSRSEGVQKEASWSHAPGLEV